MTREEAFQQFLNTYAHHPDYISPRGSSLNALSWQTEAPLRMLLNNLDKDVAENPSQLIVYGGTGRAARDPLSLQKILYHLFFLKQNQSLLVQSGKAVGIVRSQKQAPRVLIANSNLVPKWANWECFESLYEKGLTMYGQMTAGSWIYIGSQGILQGTYETFASLARKHFNSSLKGKIVVSGGLGGMGGAQPLAVTMNGGVFIGFDVDRSRIEKRIKMGYLDDIARDLNEAIEKAKRAKQLQIPYP